MGAFTIYQTPTGFTAVTNPVQRQILELLEEGPQQLPQLVEATGKAKATLSGVHMKELLNRELVREEAHPTDARRKIFVLASQRIGSSDVPVDMLRQAVQKYAGLAVRGQGVPIGTTLKSLAVEKAGPLVLAAQAENIGKAAGIALEGDDPRARMLGIVHVLESQGLAAAVRMDLEKLELECRPQDALEGLPLDQVAWILGGFVSGCLHAAGVPAIIVGTAADDVVRLTRP